VPAHQVIRSRGAAEAAPSGPLSRLRGPLLALGLGATLAAACCPSSRCPRTPGTDAVAPLTCTSAPTADDSVVASPTGSTIVDVRPGPGCRGMIVVTFPQEGVVRWSAAGVASSCSWELAAFAPARGALFVGPFEGPTSTAAAVDAPLPAVVVVPVSLWILTDSAGAASDMLADVVHASQLYEGSRAGVRLEVLEVDTVTGPDRVLRAFPPCLDDATWARRGNRYYSDSTINIYVDLVIPQLGEAHGYHCYNPDPNAPDPSNVVHVAYRWHQESTVAHEIGHALRLRRNCGHPNEGQSDGGCVCFDASNIMWDGDSALVTRYRFTLGQVFRMNSDSLSWLNRRGLRGVPLSGECQADCWAEGCKLSRPCACIDLDDRTPPP